MQYYVKATMTDPGNKENKAFIAEQGWLHRFRGPFKTEKDAEDYLAPFKNEFTTIIFEVKEMDEKKAALCAQAIFPPVQYRDEELKKELNTRHQRSHNDIISKLERTRS